MTNAFLTGMKPSTIVLPWEQPWLAPIFGDPLAAPSLSMPANWNAQFMDPTADVFPGVEVQPKEPMVFTVSRCNKNRVDRSFVDERGVQTDKAIAKLKCLLEVELEFSGVGRQLMNEPTEQGRSQYWEHVALGRLSKGSMLCSIFTHGFVRRVNWISCRSMRVQLGTISGICRCHMQPLPRQHHLPNRYGLGITSFRLMGQRHVSLAGESLVQPSCNWQ